MGKPLSYNHAINNVQNSCGNCHYPFEGVQDNRCAFPCHAESAGNKPTSAATIPYWNEIHYANGNFENQDCLSCHPANCHSVSAKQKDTIIADQPENTVQCDPKIVENLILKTPFTNSTCASCHSSGCKRSTRCIDCHAEHLDGMPMSINRAGEKFPGKFVFSKVLQDALMQKHPSDKILVQRILPLGKTKSESEEIAREVDRIASRMPSDTCMGCHPGALTRKPLTFEQMDASTVTRKLFSHNVPGHVKYKCGKCHRQPWLTQRDTGETLFTMEDCAKCHYADDCSGCHNFHDPVDKPGARVDLPMKLQYILQESANATIEESTQSTPESATSEKSIQ